MPDFWFGSSEGCNKTVKTGLALLLVTFPVFGQFFLVEFHIYSRLVLVPVNTGQQGYTRSATKGLILYSDNNFLKLCNTSYS